MRGLVTSLVEGAVLAGFALIWFWFIHFMNRPHAGHPLHAFPPLDTDVILFDFGRAYAPDRWSNGAGSKAGVAGLHLAQGFGAPRAFVPWAEVEFPGGRYVRIRRLDLQIRFQFERPVEICRDIAEHGKLTQFDPQPALR